MCEYQSASTIANIKKVLSVQKRFTKRLKGLREVDYQNRLLALGLDLTLTYKILFGLIDVDRATFFNIYNGPPLRGHIYRVRCNKQRLKILVFTCLVPVL